MDRAKQVVPVGEGASARQAIDHEAQTIVAPNTAIASLPSSSGPSPTGAAWSAVGSSRERVGGRYEILGLVGSGGMGTVYRARDVELEEVVALKVLRRELVDTPGILERFRREAKLSRRVTHRNVARVFDIGEHEGEKFLTMEFVDGEPLSSLLARERWVGITRAIEIASSIAAGLSGAHAAGVVHRDLKPDNVLLAKDGRVVVTDFGIARALADAGAANTVGLMLGTPAYMAPEQVEGRDDIDARADVYAFGALLFELLTGARAWAGDSPFAVAAARLMSPPPDPRAHRVDLPPACADLVLACMARRREDRPASIDVVAASLAVLDVRTPLPTLASPQAIAERSKEPVLTPPLPSSPARPGEKTVAVLPFRNAGAPADDYLAEELTDDLIDSLSMTRGLKVRARGMVQRFRGEHDPREVGRELGVQVVVEGSVRRAGGRVRVSARLVGVADGFQLWAKRFDRPEQEVLAINDEASHAIVDALTVDLGGTPRAAAREAPSDPAVIDLYLRARHEYRKFGAAHSARAIELFEQAERLAPGDPMILASKALALARRSFAEAGSVDLARAEAERAIAIAPNLGDARLALGSVLFQLGEGKLAARELRQAVTRSPGLAEAHAVLGRLLVEAGALDDGMRRLEAAIELDRDVPLAHGALARAHALRGEWAEVERVCQELRRVEGDPGAWMFEARMALWRRDRAAAERLLATLPPTLEVAGPRIVLALVATGRLPTEAETYLRQNRASEGTSRRRAFFLQIEVEVSAFLGDEAGVLEHVDRAEGAGLLDVVWLERCPLLDPHRGHPRFVAAHARVKQRTDEILAAYRAP